MVLTDRGEEGVGGTVITGRRSFGGDAAGGGGSDGNVVGVGKGAIVSKLTDRLICSPASLVTWRVIVSIVGF